MTTQRKTAAPQATRRKITLERTYKASVEDVWDLWTTQDGIESWWGPEGFTVKVRKLDLRVGGELLYAMIATSPAMIEAMKQSGAPTTTEARITFDEIVPHQRLAYTNVVDFIPGVEAYDVTTQVELHATAQGVRMVVIVDAMHDEAWTQRATAGFESQLGKLDRRLA